MPGTYTSQWRPVYERYRLLESLSLDQSRATGSHHDRALHVVVRSFKGGHGYFRSRLAEYRGLAAEQGWHQPRKLIEELVAFADRKADYNSNAPGFIFEDVYHFAFDALFSDWHGIGEPPMPVEQGGWLYRGQRDDTWPILLSVLRPTGQPLKEKAQNTCRIAHAISKGLGKPFADGVAIAQHYSGTDLASSRKLDVATWFADFSNDPWVALFFASDGGLDGGRGIVWNVLQSEIAKVFAGVVGELQLVVPHDIPRIRHQSGVFVTTAHAAFFDQYVPFQWSASFRQHTGLIFEDARLGTTKDWIYPPADWVADRIFDLCDRVEPCACDPTSCQIPPELFADPADPGVYLDLLKAWGPALNAGQFAAVPEARLVELAKFHAALHSPAYAAKLSTKACRSLHHLRVGLSRLMYVPSPPFEPATARDAALHAYVDTSAFGDTDGEALKGAIDKLLPL